MSAVSDGEVKSGESSSGSYVHALRFRALTRLYDPLVRWTSREGVFKRELIAGARLERARAMLDLGCGTGTLAVLASQAAPELEVTGIDGDPEVLDRARRKAEDRGLSIELERGLATRLPYEADSFDRVLSSLLFHHLNPSEKRAAAREIVRVLEPGGEAHIADWGRPHDHLMRAAFLGVQLLDGFETTAESVAGALPGILAGAGLVGVSERARLRTPLGTISLLSGRAPNPLGQRSRGPGSSNLDPDAGPAIRR